MQRYSGQNSRYAAVLAFLALAHISSHLAVAADSPRFVQLASVNAVVGPTAPAKVTLVSCCEDDSCATPSCDTSGGCDLASTCDGCCDSSGCGFGIKDHLAGLLKRSDPCFDGFISPMTNPFFFEDPRTLTEARFIYARHTIPLAVGRGNVDVFALQMRAAVTERLSIIATKDGFLTSSNPAIDDGWFDINAGFKYNLIRCPERQLLYSLGATYEMPVGSTRALQGNGDGTINLFSTLGKRFGGWNTLLSKGWILPLDGEAESSWFFLSGHISHRLGDSNFYVLAEGNWYAWTNSGQVGPNGVEGLDAFNFGSVNVEDNNIVTGALGIKYKPSRNWELGFAWETPLTDRRDILENRLTFDCILRY